MKTTVSAFLILNALLQCVFFVSGCSGARHRSPPASATMSAPGVNVSQVGEAAAPAKIESKTRKTVLTLPAGTEVVPDFRTGAFSYRLLADSVVTSEFSDTSAAGPSSFAPDAPPTASEQAFAFGVRGSFILGGVLALLGLLFAWRGHGKAAGLAFLGAVGVPAAVQFIGSGAGKIVAAVSITGALGLFVAWHLMEWRKKKAAEQAAAVGRNLQSFTTSDQ